MAEFLWTFAVTEVLKKVVTIAAEQIGLAWGLEKELSKLRKWLLKAETILRDINTRKLHNHSVKLWVEDLQHLVRETDDLLDQLVYEDLRRKVEAGKMKKVRDFVSPSNNTFAFRRKMAKRMKNLMDLLYKHYCEASPLGLVGDESMEMEIDLSQLRETVSELDDSEVVGRDAEVSDIVKQVIDASNQQITSILCIVGMGGLGKTTLAKLVFNHELVKGYFDKTIWVCVSQPFLVNKILGAILQSLKGSFGGWDNKEALLHEIQREMHGKRYFLVLDDVWNENSSLWDDLKYCLIRIAGKAKNSILVTTRSSQVAQIMKTVPSHRLSKLSDDQCWSLFKKNANANGLSMTSSLEVIQEAMVKKIGGIPLVATVLGRAFKFEGDFESWLTMLESIVRSPLQEGDFALSILKLSVDRLPSASLKQCFAYCSNFPKDFVFEKQQLIQMWMAQGFIQPREGSKNINMEDIGEMYFTVLLSRCLFQDVIIDNRGRSMRFKMHDLIHDIACIVSNDEKLDPNTLSDGQLWMNGSDKLASKLHTLVCYKEISCGIEKVINTKVVNFGYLRVLVVMNSWSINNLPDSIGKLKHLRYLDISNCSIKRLPESMGLLYNLQTLRIGGSPIEELPKYLRELVSLRHFEFSVFAFDKTKQMPRHLSQLTQLQTLSNFVAGFEKGCKVTELGPLNNLKGSLKLSNLEHVESKEEAKAAKLVEKGNLSELVFQWSLFCERNGKQCSDLEVLEGLQPHNNLQSLSIEYFAGKRLPNSIFVENLVAIRLQYCENCEMLPMLGHLTNLEELHISSLYRVGSIGNEFYGNFDSQQRMFFPKLKKFEIKEMDNLEQWEELRSASNVTTFPRLEVLDIYRCPRLLNIPDLFGYSCDDQNGVKHLRFVNIWQCYQLAKLPNGLQFCPSIQCVRIDNPSILTMNFQNKHKLSSLRIGHLHELPQEFAYLTNLKEIEIFGCMGNYDFSPLVHLPSLTKLKLVDDLGNATQLPQQLEHLTTLQVLLIRDFGGIETLPEWLGNLGSLQTLSLSFCVNLKLLPSKEAMLRLTRLSLLYVFQCPQLRLDEGSSERAKLSHLPTIGIHVDGYFHSDFF